MKPEITPISELKDSPSSSVNTYFQEKFIPDILALPMDKQKFLFRKLEDGYFQFQTNPLEAVKKSVLASYFTLNVYRDKSIQQIQFRLNEIEQISKEASVDLYVAVGYQNNQGKYLFHEADGSTWSFAYDFSGEYIPSDYLFVYEKCINRYFQQPLSEKERIVKKANYPIPVENIVSRQKSE